MNQWEVFVDDLSELAEGKELELSIRTLNLGIHMYTYKRVTAKVSSSLEEYADQLQVRLGRGQLSKSRFSIQILGEIQRCPAKYL